MSSPNQTPGLSLHRTPRPGVTGPVLDAVERWNRVGLGVAAFAVSQSEGHLARALAGAPAHGHVESDAEPFPEAEGPHERTDAPVELGRTLWDVLPGALLALALEGEAVLFDLIAATEVRVAAVVGSVTSRGPAAWALRTAYRILEPWEARWRAEQRRNVDAAAAFLASVGPSSLDELLARIDVERVVDRVPIDYVVDRVDVNSIVTGVVNELRYTDLLRESTGAFLRESTGVLAATTADVVRGQVGAVSRMTGLPFLRQSSTPTTPSTPTTRRTSAAAPATEVPASIGPPAELRAAELPPAPAPDTIAPTPDAEPAPAAPAEPVAYEEEPPVPPHAPARLTRTRRPRP